MKINIGNDQEEIKMYQLANILKKLIKRNDIKILKKKNNNLHSSPKRRIPDISEVYKYSKTKKFIQLKEGCEKLLNWYEKTKS